MGAAYVLETARILQLDRVVLCSSSTLYLSLVGGEDNGAYGFEEAYPRPDNVYAANKQAAEDLGRAYQKTFGLDVVAVRYAAMFGPWAPGGGGVATTAMERWLRGAMAGDAVEVGFSGGDWVYSKDAAKGTHLACWADHLESRLFNLGMGQAYDTEDIAGAINAAVPGGRAKGSTDGPPPRLIMNIDRARRELGFEVEFPMDAAMRDSRDWITRTA
jgi:nucleoside-diphosphate-sugar epimerase